MKILHVGFSIYGGGAGVAARRLNKALNESGHDSRFMFLSPHTPGSTPISRVEKKLNGLQNVLLGALIGSGRSINLFPTRVLGAINGSDADVVHLHWIHGEMLSIGQISRINKPLVWTFHDMWPICGADHYVDDATYETGYADKPGIDGWVYRRKLRSWKDLQVEIVTPGTWIGACVNKSKLFSSHPLSVVFNCLDLNVFIPGDRQDARNCFGFDLNKKLLLFGAYNLHSSRKGGDLLHLALEQLDATNIELVVFGAEGRENIAGIPTRWMGRIEDEERIACLYRAVDAMCVPSRQETFGQTASEPMACGVPVVAFNATGLKDVVDHKVNGYLAKPFSAEDFARGIEWVLGLRDNDPKGYARLQAEARKKAERCFAGEVVAKQHEAVYRSAIETFGKRGAV